jgi:hypothetical protein
MIPDQRGVGMKRFVAGEDRQQTTLLADSLEDHATDENPVRVIDVLLTIWA